jgi:CRISPR-associated protein Cas1
MAATQTVPQVLQSHKSLSPHLGVVTLFGYGSSVRVERGHLVIEDGIGPDRRYVRFARVGHGLKRLVVMGSDGTISFAALRWLANQKASFLMLERDGAVLATTGPVHPSDARLRRAQALAIENRNALHLAIRLIDQKLAGQEVVARERLRDSAVAEAIAQFRSSLKLAERLETVLRIEASAANSYWSAWSRTPVQYPRSDLIRVPEHWRTFGARVSPLTGSPRLAVNPPNAALNYLYAILEAEARLAAAELGLDPGLGVLHKDTPNRDSLACDLMEPVRPFVDAYVFDWLHRGPLRREWFFEESNGNCRLMGEFAAQLAETSAAWRKAVAPYAEEAARVFWSGRAKRLPTRLTQARRSLAKAGNLISNAPSLPAAKSRCLRCGGPVTTGSLYCVKCTPAISRENILEAAKLGRIATHSPAAEARRAASRAKQADAIRQWNPADLPSWLDDDYYRQNVLPRLSSLSAKKIQVAMDVSHPYATLVKRGLKIPHPRHWKTLGRLTKCFRVNDR